MNMRAVGWVWTVLGLLLAGVANPLVAGDLVARGKGLSVTRDELDRLVVEQKVLLEGRGQQVMPDQEARMEAVSLDRLIMRRLLSSRATDEDRRKAREVVAKGIADQQARLGSAAAYRRQILASGGTVEEVEARLLEQAVADQVVFRELGPKVEVTEAQVREFYDSGVDVQGRELQAMARRLEVNDRETAFYRDATNRLEVIRRTNLDRLERPGEARARVLVLFTRDQATGAAYSEELRAQKKIRIEELRRRAVAGEDFGKLATDHSEEPEAAKNRGEYVAWETQVAPELKDALFSKPVKEISEIIVSDKGFYLIQVLERKPGGKVPLAEAQADIKALLERQEVENRLPAWVAELRKESGVEILLKPK